MANPVYLQSELVEIYTTTWVDITPYVIKDIQTEWGIDGAGVADRTAGTGEFTIVVNNSSGLFTVGAVTAISGFDHGNMIRYTIEYDDRPFVMFYGKIDSIEPTGGAIDDNEIKIVALDWFDDLAKFIMVGFQMYTNKTSAEGIQLIIDGMERAPLATSFTTAGDVFPSIFDTLKSGTRGLSEANKLNLSELGWFYLVRDKDTGERVVVESRTERDAKDVSEIAVLSSESDFLVTEAGDYLMTELSEYLILNQTEVFYFDDNMMYAKTSYGSNLLNDLSMVSLPRRVDTSPQVLYEVSSRISLPAGITISNLRASYKDSSGGSDKINADPATMVTPVINTDYTMFANSDGTGTDLTANLVLTPSFAVDGVTFTIENTGATNGYVWLRFRGYGIYTQDSITYQVKDTASIAKYGTKSQSITQNYQADPIVSEGLANFIVGSRASSAWVLESIEFTANASKELMSAFLYFDIGMKSHFKVTRRNIDAEYFIQKIKYNVSDSGIIKVKYELTDALSVEGSPWLLEVDGRTELNYTTIVGF